MIEVNYDGRSLTKRFLVGEINRPMPEFKARTTEYDGLDGVTLDGIDIGPREVSFKVAIANKSGAELQSAARTLTNILAVKQNPATLTFSDEVDKEGNQLKRRVVPLGAFDVEEFMNGGVWTCRFIQFSPFLIGKERSKVIEKGQVVTLDTGGNAYTWPTVSVMSPGKEYTLSATPSSAVVPGPDGVGGVFVDAAEERHVTFSSGGEPLTIDMKKQKVSGDGKGSGLQLGSRFFRLNGAMVVQASAKTTLTWNERWL